jgi:hypothetical protein
LTFVTDEIRKSKASTKEKPKKGGPDEKKSSSTN